jgi:hypothetical protein
MTMRSPETNPRVRPARERTRLEMLENVDESEVAGAPAP